MVHVVRALPPALEAFARDEPAQDVDMINPLLNSRELQRLSVCRIPFLGAACLLELHAPRLHTFWSLDAPRLHTSGARCPSTADEIHLLS